MQIISLNAFEGEIFEPLMEFVEQQAAQTDVFCFQEMDSAYDSALTHAADGRRLNLLQEISARLPDFEVRFAGIQENFNLEPSTEKLMEIGNATFVRKTFPIIESHDFFIYGERNTYVVRDFSTLGTNALCVRLQTERGPLTICNVYGTSRPSDKLDTPERLAQSRKVIEFLRTQEGEKVVMGDLNLLPQTESVALFERAGYRNLITEYCIQTTRGSLMRKLYPQFEHGPYGFQEFADYIFVSNGLEVQGFEVPDLPISDHLPMILRVS